MKKLTISLTTISFLGASLSFAMSVDAKMCEYNMQEYYKNFDKLETEIEIYNNKPSATTDILSKQVYRSCKNIMSYCSLPSVIDEFNKNGIKPIEKKCDNEKKIMEMYKFQY